MKAAQFVARGEALRLVERDRPVPGSGDVLLRVDACGVCGSDIHLASDAVFNLPSGAVLGHEYSAEIIGLGDGVSGLATGQRVAVFPVASCGHCAACQQGRRADCPDKRLTSGGFAEHAVVQASQCFLLPDTMPAEHGALAEPLAVGLHGVAKAELKPDARVLVIGAGPIGLVTAWWARRLGATRVAVTASSMRKAELSLQMGADVFLRPDQVTPEGVADALGGQPDVVFECAGKPGLIDKGISLIRRGGTVLGLGLITEPDTLDALGAMRKEARIQMAAYFTSAEFRTSIRALAEEGDTIARMITGRVGLPDLPQAFEELKQGSSHCKVMVSMH